jgi:hypothetical protein
MAETTKLSVEKALGKIREADMQKSKNTRMDEEIAELDEETKRMRAQRLRLERLQRRSTKPDWDYSSATPKTVAVDFLQVRGRVAGLAGGNLASSLGTPDYGDATMNELLVAVGLIAGVIAAHEIGFWIGSLKRKTDEPFDRQVALVRTSTAALVAFLVSFAFSGAASRFTNRQDLIVREANALETAYLRADTIAEPQRGELNAALKEYSADRVTLLSREGRDQIEPLLAKVSGLHERMWRSATTATQDNAPLMAVVLPPINEVTDLHSMHLAMARRHLPIPILAVPLGTAAISLGIIGFGNGRVGRRFSSIDAVMEPFFAAALWMTIDMDYPGGGMIRVSNRPVVEALAAMK